MKHILLFSILLVCAEPLFCQSPYSLNWKKESIIYTSTFSLLGIDLIADARLEPFTEAEILTKSATDVNRFDRPATTFHSEKANKRSNIVTFSTMSIALAVPATIPLSNTQNDTYVKQAFILGNLLLECNLVSLAGAEITKSIVKRTRPYVYNNAFPIEEQTSKDARRSFFSGHTNSTATNAYFIAKVYSDYYPTSKLKPLIWTAAALIPAYTGLERVRAGKHFPTDVIVGYIYGAACGYFIPQLHKKELAEKTSSIKLYPSNNKGINVISLSLSL